MAFVVFAALAAAGPAEAPEATEDATEDATLSAPATEAGFSSDRPAFSNTTGISPVARLTLEMSVAGVLDNPGGLALPGASLRVGVHSWAELRLRGMGAVMVFDDSGDTSFGLGDVFVGTKIGGAPFDWFAIALLFEVGLPTATDGNYLRTIGDVWGSRASRRSLFGAPEAVPSAELIFDIIVRPWMTITGDLVVASDAFEDPALRETVRYAAGGGSLQFHFTVIDGSKLFAQGFFTGDERSDTSLGLGGGVIYMALPNVQIDLSFDVGVTSPGPPPEVLAGATLLF